MTTLLRVIVLALALVGIGAVAGCDRGVDPVTAHAHELERRLLAPCCWRQILEDHDSPVATALRREIRDRIAAGEAAADVERDLVARYGENIRALPEDRDPKWMIAAFGVGAALVGLGVLGAAVRRWRRASAARSPLGTFAPEPEAYADRLDDELATID